MANRQEGGATTTFGWSSVSGVPPRPTKMESTQHYHRLQRQQSPLPPEFPPPTHPPTAFPSGPSLEPYVTRLERFELFSTNQCYYIVGSNKLNTAYRIIKIDRTLIERPNYSGYSPTNQQPHQNNGQSMLFQQHPQTTTPSISGSRSFGAVSSFSPRRPFASGTMSNADFGGTGSGVGISASSSEVPTVQQSSSMISNSNAPTATTATQNSNNNNSAADGQHTANPKSRPLSDFVTEDPNVYTQEEIKDVLDMIHDGNRMTRSSRGGYSNQNMRQTSGGGGLKPIVKAYGIVGFIRFLDSYYLTLITKRAKVGSIGGNGIYTIKNTETIPLKPAERQSEMEDLDPSSVLLSMWNRGKRSVGLGLSNREIAELRYQGIYQVLDLSKSFFFSYTYDLTRTLQENFLATTSRPFPPPPFKDTFAWNYFLTREFEGCLNADSRYQWVLPIVHGAFVQRKIQDYGRSLDLMLIARRSRHFAGTRYLKRGVSDQGKVANDVEHEQILEDSDSSTGAGEPGASSFCSFIQVRGSIPTFWTQESSVTMPKPPIELNRVDPTYKATQLHFEDLFQRYATPVLVLDLVKQSEKRAREVLVGNEYRHAVDYINETIDNKKHQILYCSFDYSHTSKHRQLDVSSSLSEISTWAVNCTGFFCSNPKWKIGAGGVLEPFTQEDRLLAQLLSEKLSIPVFPMEQSGVLRTNCIDCLDRTNVAQFSAGVEAISQQLVVMGIRSQSKLDPASNIVRVLIDMYVDIGDSIALQYGGSEAHKKVTAGHAESNIMPIGKHKELLTSIRRYYSNAFTDRLKQDAINLFLGYYVPYMHAEPLWEMETDYYLHNFHVKEGRGVNFSMDFYRHAYGIQVDDIHSETLDRTQRVSRGSSVDTSGSSRKSSSTQLGRMESHRVENVRRRVASQNEALSIWWKSALHSNLQQRIWMKNSNEFAEGGVLGIGVDRSLLPSRYERLYQPEKMALFDRFFARTWATPLRSSHTAQHTHINAKEPESAFGGSLSRVITAPKHFSFRPQQENTNTKRHDGAITRKFFEANGFDAPFESKLQLFVEPHDRATWTLRSSPDFVGDLSTEVTRGVPEEYRRYCTSSSTLYSTPLADNEKAKSEFKATLCELCLQADDVDGIRKLSESAHLSRIVLSGPYRGLSSDESAIEFATALHEQFSPMESSSSRTTKQIASELKRRGFDFSGVTEIVESRFKSFQVSEQQLSEVLDHPIDACHRSDLTTPASLKQYVSLYDHATQLSTPDLIFISGRKTMKASSRVRVRPQPQGVSFAKRASRLGIDIGSHSESTSISAPSLFPVHVRKTVPSFFEQINDDMFARSDNKFMVFNGPGADSWQGTEPVTRILKPDDVFFVDLVTH